MSLVLQQIDTGQSWTIGYIRETNLEALRNVEVAKAYVETVNAASRDAQKVT